MHLLTQGELVGMPTETVYGLAGDATNASAIAKIYGMKGRPSFNPLIIHGHSVEQLEEIAVFNEAARMLAQQCWPGPLTLVLPRHGKSPVDLLASGGLPTVAVRIPQHPVALELIKAFGKPLAAPSANLSNKISPTSRSMVLRDFPILHVLEGGDSALGLESTIVDLTGSLPVVLRPGGMTCEDLEKIIGKVTLHQGDTVLAPGMTKKHYAPRHPLRLNAVGKRAGEILIGFGDTPNADLNLSPRGDLVEAAANLYRMLNQADDMAEMGMREMEMQDEAMGVRFEASAGEKKEGDSRLSINGIAIVKIPNTTLGLAMNDRLNRAVG